MSIADFFSNALSTQNMNHEEIRNVLQRTEAKISFWGSRIVVARGYSGSIVLDELITKVHINAVKHIEAHDFPNGRLACLGHVEELKRLYNDSDAALQHANVFSFIVHVLGIFFFPSTICNVISPRNHLFDGGLESIYRCVTPEYYRSLFGEQFFELGLRNRPWRNGEAREHQYPFSDGAFIPGEIFTRYALFMGGWPLAPFPNHIILIEERVCRTYQQIRHLLPLRNSNPALHLL